MSAADFYLKIPSQVFPQSLRNEIWMRIQDNDWVPRKRVLEDDNYQGNISWCKTTIHPSMEARYKEIFSSNLSDQLNEIIRPQQVLLSLQKIDKNKAFGVHYDQDICSIQMVLGGDKFTPVKFWNADPRADRLFLEWGNFPYPDATLNYSNDIFYLNTTKWHDNNGLKGDRYLLRFILNLNQQSHLNYEYFKEKLNGIL